jgi:hypothetical protein
MLAKTHLAGYGISINVANEFIMSNLGNLALIYDTCKTFSVTNDMIAEILADNFPGLNGTIVANFFDLNGLDSSALNPPAETIDPLRFSNTNYLLGTTAIYESPGVAELDSGISWDYDTLTFSFNDYIPRYYYEYGPELTKGFSPLSNSQRDSIRDIMSQLDDILSISLIETPDAGDIRFSLVDQASAAFAFYPGDSEISGDVFLSTEFNNPNSYYDYTLTQGGYGWGTIVHELGHAFGLEHPFGDYSINPSQNGSFPHLYSIMSYTNLYNIKPVFTLEGNSIQFQSVGTYPDLFSLYDLNTLQALYGANSETNIGNDIYTYNFADFKYQTIWDSGGIDTFDLSSNIGNTTLNLKGGSLNSIDEYSFQNIVDYAKNQVDSPYFDEWIESTLHDYYFTNELYTGKNNVAIGTGVIIENAMTGSGNDLVIDNEVDNIIHTGLGDDIIYIAYGGYDQVDGGVGTDILRINSMESDVNITNFEEAYLLMGDNYGVKFNNIEYIGFLDGSTKDLDYLLA